MNKVTYFFCRALFLFDKNLTKSFNKYEKKNRKNNKLILNIVLIQTLAAFFNR